MSILTQLARARVGSTEELLDLMDDPAVCAREISNALVSAAARYMQAAETGDAKQALEAVADLLNAACAHQIVSEVYEDHGQVRQAGSSEK